jgi:hypothetical protein
MQVRRIENYKNTIYKMHFPEIQEKVSMGFRYVKPSEIGLVSLKSFIENFTAG